MAEKTEAQKRAQRAYMETVDRIGITVPQGYKAQIQTHAEACSESVNGFINRAISETMQRDNAAPGASKGH